MEKEREELLETFKRLEPENQAFLLTYARATYTAQESTKKRFLNSLKAFVGEPAYELQGQAMEAVNG